MRTSARESHGCLKVTTRTPNLRLTRHWTHLRYHPVQRALWCSDARFCVVPSGRRSGKTELAKRFLVASAIWSHWLDQGLFVAAGPTQQQAKDIWWSDLKRLVPSELVSAVYETQPQTLRLVNGNEIRVAGMDRPQRIEGRPLDGIGLDEFGNMKEHAWPENIRPALSTPGRPGFAWLTGVPEGRNHYHRLYRRALSDETGEWAVFSWPSSDILPRSEVESARASLDELTFQQEYEANFVNFTGRAYHAFDPAIHAAETLEYDRNLPIGLCFDFNREPGVCAIVQEQEYVGGNPLVADYITAVIGEVWIPRNSNTLRVCDRILEDWGQHPGEVELDGDATGGARTSSSVEGSDWDLVESKLRRAFGGRMRNLVPTSNPRERARVNAMNSRLRSADGRVRMLVCPQKAPNVVDDLDGVVVIEGGVGEIDKKADPMRSHLTDAIGYRVARKFGIAGTPRVTAEPL